jgi:hypothetical protein
MAKTTSSHQEIWKIFSKDSDASCKVRDARDLMYALATCHSQCNQKLVGYLTESHQ